MTAYIVDGEILNEIFGDVSTPIGNVEKIGEKSTLRKIAEGISSSKNIYEIIDSIYRHTMTKVLKELSEEENAKNH